MEIKCEICSCIETISHQKLMKLHVFQWSNEYKVNEKQYNTI